VKAVLVAPKGQKKSDITNLAVVAMNSSGGGCSAVAAATGHVFFGAVDCKSGAGFF